MVHGWPQETVLAGGRTVLLVEEGVNLVGHLREKGQILPRKSRSEKHLGEGDSPHLAGPVLILAREKWILVP